MRGARIAGARGEVRSRDPRAGTFSHPRSDTMHTSVIVHGVLYALLYNDLVHIIFHFVLRFRAFTITMKFDNVACVSFTVAVAITTSVDAVTPLLSHRHHRDGTTSGSSFALCAKVGIWYSSSTGNTDTVAAYIAKAAGVDDFSDIGDAKKDEIESADALIVGAPTWHTGADKQRSGTSWDEWYVSCASGLILVGRASKNNADNHASYTHTHLPISYTNLVFVVSYCV